MSAVRAQIESLLRARKLDGTLTTAAAPPDADRLAATGWRRLDAQLGGGLARGHLSEIVGGRSCGISALIIRLAATAIGRGEVVALVDTHDRFDPASAEAAGVDLRRLLWIREAGQVDRAVRAMHLVLQAGGFGLVVLDLADAPARLVRQLPHTTGMRLARTVEGSTTVALVAGPAHLARSAGGVTIALDPPAADTAVRWQGASARARRLQGLAIHPRVVSSRTPGRVRMSAGSASPLR